MKYLFIHIPKTAGVKVRHNIHMNAGWPDATVCVQEEGQDLRYFTDDALQAFALVSGHFGYALRRRMESERRCVTVLRRPLDRVISTYFYWKTLSCTPQQSLAMRLTIYDFVASEDPLIAEQIDNGQTWQIFWDHGITARRRFAGIAASKLLERARQNLSSLDFVGLQEDIPGTLRKMQRKFGWRWTDDVAHRINPTPDYRLMDIDVDLIRERLGTRIALDEQLYSAGEELFASVA